MKIIQSSKNWLFVCMLLSVGYGLIGSQKFSSLSKLDDFYKNHLGYQDNRSKKVISALNLKGQTPEIEKKFRENPQAIEFLNQSIIFLFKDMNDDDIGLNIEATGKDSYGIAVADYPEYIIQGYIEEKPILGVGTALSSYCFKKLQADAAQTRLSDEAQTRLSELERQVNSDEYQSQIKKINNIIKSFKDKRPSAPLPEVIVTDAQPEQKQPLPDSISNSQIALYSVTGVAAVLAIGYAANMLWKYLYGSKLDFAKDDIAVDTESMVYYLLNNEKNPEHDHEIAHRYEVKYKLSTKDAMQLVKDMHKAAEEAAKYAQQVR